MNGTEPIPKLIFVYRTGKSYDRHDVANMKWQLRRFTTLPHQLCCISDDPVVADVPLVTQHRHWWSKLEMFYQTGPCVYFDLDVAILGNIDKLIMHAISHANSFSMMEPCTELVAMDGSMSSSIMCWNGDFSFLLHEFQPRDYRFMGDQDYITCKLRASGVDIGNITEIVPTYKWSERAMFGIPPDTAIVNFFAQFKPRLLGLPFWGRHLNE
jgi:hypothetical protein